MNGIEIKDRSDFALLYEDNPGLAIGILYENINGLKKQCACRYDKCQQEKTEMLEKFKSINRFGRLKNWAMQVPGGIVGGSITAYIIFKIWLDVNFDIKLPGPDDVK